MFIWVLCVFSLVLRIQGGAVPVAYLNDGNVMPEFGLGTWLGLKSKGVTETVKNEDVRVAVENAIDAGYRHIDTAALYTTEPLVGRGIKNKIQQGVIKREDVFITTKLWNDHHAREKVPKALKTSLRNLDMNYVDLYLIHWPLGTYPNQTFDDTDYLDTWRGMIDIKQQGLAKSIGVSNFNEAMLERLIQETGVVPAVLQIEVSLTIQQPKLLDYCHSHNISVMGYTPFGGIFDKTDNSPPPRATTPELVAIAAKYNKTVPQVVLRYVYELGVTPIPKSVKKQRIEENINIFDFRLDDSDKKLLSSYDRHYRSLDLSFWKSHPYFPF